jgi:hypothetical protein
MARREGGVGNGDRYAAHAGFLLGPDELCLTAPLNRITVLPKHKIFIP